MLKDNIDKLCSLYMAIENTLTRNINTINTFFAEQFANYDNLGTEMANATGSVSDSIGNVNNVNPTLTNSNIANTVTQGLNSDFNSERVQLLPKIKMIILSLIYMVLVLMNK